MTVLASVSSPANGTVAMHELLTALCAAGNVVKAYGDGLSAFDGAYNTATNPFGSAASGAGNLGNTSAWARVAAPDGSREFLFQRASSDTSWWHRWSNNGFVGGSPNATTVPTATDSYETFAGASVFSATPGRWFISCDDAAPYGWTAFAMALGGGNVRTFLADEPLLTSVIAPEDVDPYVWIGYWNGTGLSAAAGFILGPSQFINGWKKWPSGSVAGITYGAIYDTSSGAYILPAGSTSVQVGPTPTGVKEVPQRILVFRSAAASSSAGYCGYTGRHRYATVGGRANGDKLVDGANHWIYAAGLWIPWDPTTPTLS